MPNTGKRTVHKKIQDNAPVQLYFKVYKEIMVKLENNAGMGI
jgi:hypothetical protein